MKKTVSLLLVLVLALSLCACGSKSSGGAVYAREEASYAYDSAPAALYTEGEYYAEEAAVGGFGMNAANAADAKRTDGGDAPDENPEKIIYSADVTVETTEFEQALAKLDELLAACGGWVESSSVNGSNFYNKSRGITSTRSSRPAWIAKQRSTPGCSMAISSSFSSRFT